ncbi:MAG: Gfo/Idh/MocA family oxidoreductase [Bacteroidia bacterium]
MKPIKTALCSFGMSGKVFHAPLLDTHAGFELASVWQRTKSDAKQYYPDIKIARQLEEILADESIDLVVVNTPEPTHFPFCKAALEAGKHVVVEKAFTTTVEEADELVRLAERLNLCLSVYHNRRWDGDFLTVQKLIQEGILGRLVEYEAHYDRYRTYIQDNWKEIPGPGKGLLYNLGSHLIDQALVLFGFPERVFADLTIERAGGKIEDAFQLHLYYPGLKAILKSSYLVREAGPRYKVLGEQGSFYKWGLDPQEDALKQGIRPSVPQWGEEDEANYGHIHTEQNGLVIKGRIPSLAGNYMDYYQNIYEAIREGVPLAVSPEDGRDVMRVIDMAERSAQEGRIISA